MGNHTSKAVGNATDRTAAVYIRKNHHAHTDFCLFPSSDMHDHCHLNRPWKDICIPDFLLSSCTQGPKIIYIDDKVRFVHVLHVLHVRLGALVRREPSL